MPASVTFRIQGNSNSSLAKNHMLEHSSEESDEDDDHHQTSKNQLSKSDNQGEAILLDIEENPPLTVSSSRLYFIYHYLSR